MGPGPDDASRWVVARRCVKLRSLAKVCSGVHFFMFSCRDFGFSCVQAMLCADRVVCACSV